MDELQRLYECYLENVVAYVAGSYVQNGGRWENPDESFMSKVEECSGIMSFARDDFRRQTAVWYALRTGRKESTEVGYQPLVQRGLERLLVRGTFPKPGDAEAEAGDDGAFSAAAFLATDRENEWHVTSVETNHKDGSE